MVAFTKPQQRKKEESERLEEREIRSTLLIIDLNEIGQLIGFRKASRRHGIP